MNVLVCVKRVPLTGGIGQRVVQPTSQAELQPLYARHAAILGPDPRGGAMAMLFATEMAGLQ